MRSDRESGRERPSRRKIVLKRRIGKCRAVHLLFSGMSDAPTLPGPATAAAGASDVAATPEGTPDATSPRRASWLRQGGTAPPRRRRRPFVRVLIALTSSTALFGVAALVAAAAMLPPIGARREARASAQREVRAQLVRDERIVASVFASQRRWTDMWRESFGIVVATDRRVLYVGATPTPLLRPAKTGRRSCSWRAIPTTRRSRSSRDRSCAASGAGSNFAPRSPTSDFLVDDATWRECHAVSTASAAARREVTQRDDGLRRSNRAPPRRPPSTSPTSCNAARRSPGWRAGSARRPTCCVS